MTDIELFRKLKQNELAPLYLLYGAETYFVNQALTQIISRAVQPGFGSFNLQQFQGEKPDWNALEDACEALPMMSDRKCVTVKDLDVDKLVKADLDRLYALLASLPESTVLVLYTVSVSVDMKKSAKYKKLAAEVEKAGGVSCEFPLKDRTTLSRALCERAKKAHVAMDIQTAGTLIDRCSSNYSVLQNELDKLIAYAGPLGEITVKQIDECCIRSIDTSAFDLAKSILSGNFDRAYHLLDELFYLRQEAISILSALSMAFADLYRAKCALSAGKSAEQVTADFRYPKNRLFAVRNAFRDVRSFSTAQIRACITALYEADRKLKSSRQDDRLILEQMLGTMLLASRS